MYHSKSILFIFVILLSVIINQYNCTIQNKIQDAIDAGYKKFIEEHKANNINLRDQKVDSKYEPLPAYKCKHDHYTANDLTLEEIKIKHNQQKSVRDYQGDDKIESISVRSINEANEIGNMRITFDTSLLGIGNDAYGCSSVGADIKVDTTASTTTPCVIDRNQDAVSPCIFDCTTRYIQTEKLVNFIKTYLLGTINTILSNAIEVERVTGNLKLFGDAGCFYGVPINSTLKTTGVPNTDYYVFVTARPTADPSTIAYAKACVVPYDGTQGIYGRPIAGIINFNPYYFYDFLDQPNPSDITFNEYVRVGLHEMVHALGFSKTFYGSYVDPNTGIKYPEATKQVTYSSKTPSGVPFTNTRQVITTPSVAAFARDHYNCKADSFTYQELENAGGAGTASSHWERRTAGEELMLGYIQPMFPLTNLTLSLLQDTGWYRIDYSSSEQLLWGKNLGCDWTQDCTEAYWNFPGYFCKKEDSPKFSCSPTRNAKGACVVYQYTGDIDPKFQHYKNATYGGDSISDYCTFSDFVPNQDLSYCQDTSIVGNAEINEVYGQNSKCFEYTLGSALGMACLQQRCTDEDYEVYLYGSWRKCPAGQSISFSTGSNKNYNFPCPLYYYPCLPVGVPVPPIDELSSAFILSINYLYLTLTVLLLLLLA